MRMTTTRMMTTRRAAWVAAALGTLGGCMPAARRAPAGNVPNGTGTAGATSPAPIVGSWRLLWLEAPGPGGALRRTTDARGSLIYTPTGQVSVQVMYPSAGGAASGGPVQYAAGGYEASFGQYVVDAATRTVTHRYDGANVRALIGQDLPRRYEVAGRRLTIRSTRPDERWTVVWERF